MAEHKSKKAKLSSKDDSSSSLDFRKLIARSRADIIEEMKPDRKQDIFFDLDVAMKTVRALIVTNEEIWNRCGRYFCHGNKFKLEIFDRVNVDNKSECGRAQVEVVSTETHESFRELPACLKLFEPKRNELGFIDFEKFFNRSLILHEDVLLPFLTNMKEHLEKVQLCLGEVDEWAMENYNNIKFIETTFSISMDAISAEEPAVHDEKCSLERFQISQRRGRRRMLMAPCRCQPKRKYSPRI